MREVKTLAVATLPDGINAGVKRVVFVISKVLSVKRQPSVLLIPHAVQFRVRQVAGRRNVPAASVC